MKEGTVKFFNNDKGIGFIAPNDSSKDIVVHASGLIGGIRRNDTVRYHTEYGRKGLNAVKVEVI